MGKGWMDLELSPRSRLGCRYGIIGLESRRIHSWIGCRKKAPEGPYQRERQKRNSKRRWGRDGEVGREPGDHVIEDEREGV